MAINQEQRSIKNLTFTIHVTTTLLRSVITFCFHCNFTRKLALIFKPVKGLQESLIYNMGCLESKDTTDVSETRHNYPCTNHPPSLGHVYLFSLYYVLTDAIRRKPTLYEFHVEKQKLML